MRYSHAVMAKNPPIITEALTHVLLFHEKKPKGMNQSAAKIAMQTKIIKLRAIHKAWELSQTSTFVVCEIRNANQYAMMMGTTDKMVSSMSK